MSSLIFNNVSSSPAAVGSGKSQLYMKDDGIVYQQVESSDEIPLRGSVIKTQAYRTTSSVTATGSYVTYATSTFNKLYDTSTSKLIIHGTGRVFDSVGANLSMSVHVDHGSTRLIEASIYDLYHSTTSPWRTGRWFSLGPMEYTGCSSGDNDIDIKFLSAGYDSITLEEVSMVITEVLI